ncbi:MAG: hypothetical protein K5669_09680 [Lachnospiraceae bacterium]|nr:hypothetical protein [Lachnospiraceae bacterium]
MSKKKNKKNKNNSVTSETVVENQDIQSTGEEAIAKETAENASDNSAEGANAVNEADDAKSGAEEKSETSEPESDRFEDKVRESLDKAEEAEENVEKLTDEEAEPGSEYCTKAREEYKKARLEQQKQAQKKSEERKEELEKSPEMDEKRLARRKRRIRNQVASYLSVFIFLAVVIVGGYVLLRVFVFDKTGDKQPEEPVVTEQQQEIINELVGEEEELPEPEPEPEPVVEEPEVVVDEEALAAAKLDEYIDGIISGMTLEQKVAGIIMTSPEALTKVNLATMAGNGTKTALEKYQVGGIIYAPQNVVSHDQFYDMITGTIGMLTNPTFLAISEEGGQSPLAKAGFYEAASTAAEVVETNDVQNAYNAGGTIGTAMAQLGLNVNLAPVADLSSDNNEVLDGRTYGSAATEAMGYISSMEDGLESGGVTACLKYFPGQGYATTDPANGRTVIDKTEEEFRSGDLLIYQASIQNGTKMIMVSNAVVTAFDDSVPATFSEKVVTEILRNEFGYNGIILSGNLGDKAIVDYYGADEAAIMALRAGCDMLVNPYDFEVAYNGIIAAVGDGTISEERINDALKRIYRIKYADSI